MSTNLDRTGAIKLAKDVMTRSDRRAELFAVLTTEDKHGLECAETVELEKLTGADAADAGKLARWLLRDAGLMP